MKKQYINRKGELVDLDDSGVVPEGGTIRVPAYLTDGVPMTSNVRVVDSAGRPAGSRPGFLYDNDANEAAAQIAYDQCSARMQDAWRGTAWTNAASNLRGAWHNSVSPPPPVDRAAAETARENYKANLSNQWRSPAAVADQAPPVTDSRPITAEDIERDRARRKQLLSEAWRTPPSVGFGGSFG